MCQSQWKWLLLSHILEMAGVLCLLTGCGKKDDVRLAATLLIGGIILLATTYYLPKIAEWGRNRIVVSCGFDSIRKISNFFFGCFLAVGIIFMLICLSEIGAHVRSIWILWSVIAISFICFQYKYRFLPILADDGKRDKRKAILGMIRTITIFTIVFGYILTTTCN